MYICIMLYIYKYIYINKHVHVVDFLRALPKSFTHFWKASIVYVVFFAAAALLTMNLCTKHCLFIISAVFIPLKSFCSTGW